MKYSFLFLCALLSCLLACDNNTNNGLPTDAGIDSIPINVTLQVFYIADGERSTSFRGNGLTLSLDDEEYNSDDGKFELDIPQGEYDVELRWEDYQHTSSFIENRKLIVDSPQIDMQLGDEFFTRFWGKLYEIVDGDTMHFTEGGTSSDLAPYKFIDGNGEFALFYAHKGSPILFNIHSPHFETIRTEIIVDDPKDYKVFFETPPQLENIEGNIDFQIGHRRYENVEATIEIDGQFIQTDSRGEFTIPFINSGNQTLTISGEGIYRQEIPLTLFSSSKLNYTVEGPSSDYYPLTINNKWTYEYDYLSTESGSDYTKIEAIINWEIVDQFVTGEDTIYTIEETWNGYFATAWVSDTTYYSDFKKVITLTNGLNGSISFEVDGSFPLPTSNFLRNGNFLRYYPSSFGESFSISPYSSSCLKCSQTTLARGIGVSNYFWTNRESGTNSPTYVEYVLIDYSFNN